VGKRLNLWQEHFKRMNWVLQINLHRNKFLIVLIKKEYQQRLQTNDIFKSDPNTLCDEYWKDDIQTWPHVDDGMLHSTSKGSGC
jgi:hypothetical protein